MALLVNVMHAVGVVPEDAEIGSGGLHGCQTVHRLVGVAHALRIGVQRDAPDALHGVVGTGELLDHVHIGARRHHRDRDHFDAEVLADREMAVVAGARTEEFDDREASPRRVAVRAEDPVAHDRVVHHVQAGVAADHEAVARDAEELGEELARLVDAFQTAVVARVDAALDHVAVEAVQDAVRQVELAAGGFPAGHIELEVAGLISGILAFKVGLNLSQAFRGLFGIVIHLWDRVHAELIDF